MAEERAAHECTQAVSNDAQLIMDGSSAAQRYFAAAGDLLQLQHMMAAFVVPQLAMQCPRPAECRCQLSLLGCLWFQE